ncbi:serine hydrolase domain-containing protein [Nonomuraea candida]|uniref:serine hydrolase domain-containing protein n=1 Tax=Nonomuraea candida TaxID=359159 RepID=UPI000693B44C|nr:serine hydrolase domain-containing protein [Nonomuraea candida]
MLLLRKPIPWRALTRALFVATSLLYVVTPASAAAAASPASPASAESSVEAFADDFVPRQLKKHQVPGAAVAVVAGGRQVLAKGYGVAEVESGRPVDAGRTVFAPASVAKLITATAVLQLVEQGRIDLDTDVNEYLTKFKIDDSYPGRPVTMAHLLTHSAGFAGGDFGTGAATPRDVHELGSHLADHQPSRIRPPGTRAVYSNYGMGLAGYLVEVRSGLPFHEYVQRHIFRPLGMTHTTMAQPGPADQPLTPGYRLRDGRQVRAEGAEYGHMPPHGAGFRSTATDMAAFMLAQLDGGGAILKPESVRLMQSRRFGNAEGTAGMGYGFQEYTRNGRRLLVHRANIPGYFAIMALVPERRIGIYASYNGSGKGGADSTWDLVNAFADRFAPAAAPATVAAGSPDKLPDIGRYAGSYRTVLAGDMTDLGKLTSLMSVVTVTAGSDGILTTTGAVALGAAESRQWTQIAPGLFREKNGYRTIRFGDDGLLATENPVGPLERLAWYQSPTLHLVTLGVSLAVLVLSTLAWPVTLAVRWVRRRPARRLQPVDGSLLGRLPGRRAPRWAGLPGWMTAALVTASAGSLVMLFANFDDNQADFFLGGSPLFTIIATLPVLAAVAGVAALVTVLLAWRHRWWTLVGRLHQSAVALAAAAYLSVAIFYNVLG